MSRRSKSCERQAEIIRVTLSLLEETPLTSLSTRQIAKQLGISQPALFRHFRSREALLMAVMEKVRADLSSVADAVLEETRGPLARIRALTIRLLNHVESYPGLARLLFSPPQKGPLRDALRQLVSMQRSLIGQLIKDGQESGVFRADTDPTNAAIYFVGMIQGIVLRVQLEEGARPFANQAEPMFSMWLDGVRVPRGEELHSIETKAAPPEAITTPSLNLFALDVRPILSSGSDPLEQILSTLATVRSAGVLTLTTPFRPAPLLRLLSERGHVASVREISSQLFSIDIVVNGAATIDELLDLEPPEPLERVLEATASLALGEVYVARLPRFPRPLLPHLSDRPITFEITEAIDGTALLHVTGRGDS
ncbi:MAG: DUF2249 domain-containing protein [Myxococcales bacterium]|nr:DUF2249 domain-containing protein [Myxococcales bacterium]